MRKEHGRFWIAIALFQIGVDGGLEVDDRAQDAAAAALAGCGLTVKRPASSNATFRRAIAADES
jgi:hypothetical protein